MIVLLQPGEMAERSNAAVLKTVDLVRGPGVRIPLSPLFFLEKCRSGRTGLIRNQLYPLWVPGVRIPLSPQGKQKAKISPFFIPQIALFINFNFQNRNFTGKGCCWTVNRISNIH